LSQKIYYIKANFTAYYTGSQTGSGGGSNKRSFVTKFHDVVLDHVEPLSYFDINSYRVGNDFIEHLNLDDVLIKMPGDGQSPERFVKTNIKDGILRNPVISETSKSGNDSFGIVTGTIYAKIEKKEPPKVAPINTPTPPIKEVSYRQEITDMIKPATLSNATSTGFSRSGCFTDVARVFFFLFILSAIFKGLSNWLFILAGIILIVGAFFLLGLFFKFLRALSNIFSIVLSFFFIFMILSIIYSYSGKQKKETDSSTVKQQDEQSETSQLSNDTLSSQTDKDDCGKNNLMAIHRRAWTDFIPQRYEGKLMMSQCFYNQSRENRESLNPNGQQIYSFYNSLYAKLARGDKNKMKLVYHMFDSIRQQRGLNQAQFADMVVSCVQDIPYRLIIDNPADLDGRMLQLYKRDGALEHIKFGVQAPAEFMYNLQGDCDTRALFCFTVLDHFGYDAAILISEYYAHAILGLALPSSGASISYRGKRYYTWETTAKGFQLGQMAPDCSNMNYWNIVLTNQ
jgi:hypothetical protein